jgi:hypothetical protein
MRQGIVYRHRVFMLLMLQCVLSDAMSLQFVEFVACARFVCAGWASLDHICSMHVSVLTSPLSPPEPNELSSSVARALHERSRFCREYVNGYNDDGDNQREDSMNAS